jgi:hypothetical protein
MGHHSTRTDYTFTPVFTHKRKQNQNPTNHQTSEREGTKRQSRSAGCAALHPARGGRGQRRGGQENTRPQPRRLRRSASRIALEAARFGRTRARVPVALPETSIWARIDQHFCSVHAPDPVVRDGERGRRLRRVQCR